jgi:hypothetical protein
MKEIFEYKHIESDLADIANNPNFSDQYRNCADSLFCKLNNSVEPTTKDYRRRIESVINYLNCGVTHESGVILDILRGEL